MRTPPRQKRRITVAAAATGVVARAVVLLACLCRGIAAADDVASAAAAATGSAAPGDMTANAWASGGGPPSAAPATTLPPVSQAYALPSAVIHGGAIPPNWQPQPIPYAGTGLDGKPLTMYVAPTYTFTFVAGPPVVAPVPAANRVNRIQANPVPMTVARAAPVPYQYPPGASALAGQAIVPPPLPAPPPQTMIAQAPVSPPPPVIAPPPVLAPPPTQWVSVPPGSTPVAGAGSDTMAQALAGAAPAAMAATAGAVAANQPPPTAALAPPPQPAPPVAEPPAPRQDPPLTPVASPTPRQAPPAAPPTTTHVWRVVGVHDGDTVTCLDETNTQQKVRLAEIDAPELGQDYGKVARESLAELVFGKTVTVQEEGKDRYGRWIAHMQVDGIDVNRRMVAGGNAWHYADYSRDQALETLQEQAQSQRLGLWAQPSPVAPWDFRQTVKKDASG